MTTIHILLDRCCAKGKGVELDLIILQAPISRTLQPLNVACFKTFKMTFKTYSLMCIGHS